MRAAQRGGLNRDDAEDCAVEYKLILAQTSEEPPDLESPGVEDKTNQEIWWHVKTCVYRRNRARQVTVNIDQLVTVDPLGHSHVPKSPATGPEDLTVQKIYLETMLRIVDALPARRKWLWRRVEMEGVRVVDLQAETGRSASALYKELHVTRKLILDRLAASQITDGEFLI